MTYHFDRAYYRLVYPMVLRPRLRVGDQAYEVVDLSEEGLRFLHSGPTWPVVGAVLVGTLELPTEQVLAVEGTIVRLAVPSIALRLSKGVPFGIMIEQQRFLHQRNFIPI